MTDAPKTVELGVIAHAELEEKFLAEILGSPQFFHYYSWFPSQGFYYSENKKIWEAIKTVHAEGRTIGLTQVATALGDTGIELPKATAMVHGILDRSMSTHSADLEFLNSYFDLLNSYYKRRRLDEFTTTARLKIRDTAKNPDWENDLQERFGAIFSGHDFFESPYVELADFDYLNQPEKQRISTGLEGLDRLLSGGLGKGDLSVLGARPSMGKSALMVWFACYAAKMGLTVDLISAEMDMGSCYERMLGCVADIVYKDLPYLKRTNPDFVRQAITKLQPIQNLIAIDAMSKDPERALAGIHTSMIRRNPDLIIIDHLHHIAPNTDREGAVNVRKFVTQLTNIAKSTNTHIMLLVQLSRGVESRTDKRPGLSDVREFGCLEELADVMFFPYRDEYYNPDTTTKQNITEIGVRKNRNGMTGSIEVYSDMSKNRYYDLIKQ